MKKLFGIITLLFLITSVFVFSTVYAEMISRDGTVYVPSLPTDLVDAEGGDVSDKVYAETIEDALKYIPWGGKIYLTSDVALGAIGTTCDLEIESYGENQYHIAKDASTDEPMFHVSGSSLAIKNVIVDATQEKSNRTIVADRGASITLGKGAEIIGNASYGAIYMDASSLTIDGGAIKNNSAVNGDVITKTASLSGTTVSAYTYVQEYESYQPLGGAALMVNGSSFVMNSGEVSGNSAKSGGAIHASDMNSISLVGGTISSNKTSYETDAEKKIACGGGVTIEKSDDCSLEISGATIANNECGYNGGGIYLDWDVETVDIAMTAGTFSENHAGRNGAAICSLANDAMVDISGSSSVFKDNLSDMYGSIYLSKVAGTELPSEGRGIANIHDGVSFTGNKAVNGSCVSVTKEKAINDITIKDCTFVGNSASQLGGAVCIHLKPGKLMIDGGTYTDNFAGYVGGAVFVQLGDAGEAIVQGGTLFKGNSADVNAGAISFKRSTMNSGGTVEMGDCEIVDNWCNANFDAYTGKDLAQTEHYNTGGLYVGEEITLYMKNAEITQNYVESGYENETIGSGVGICPHGTLVLYPDEGAKIYDNGSSEGMDILAVPWDDAIDHEVPSQLYICDTTPDAKEYNWTDLGGNEARTGFYSWDQALKEKEDEETGIATVSLASVDDEADEYKGEKTLDPVGFKANIDKQEIMTMALNEETAFEPQVRIAGNYTKAALYGGGGVMVNGELIAGDFTVSVEKHLHFGKGVSTEEKEQISEKEFEFVLTLHEWFHGANQKPEIKESVPFVKTNSDGSQETGEIYFQVYDNNPRAEAKFSLHGDEKIEFQFNKMKHGMWTNDSYGWRYSYGFSLEEVDNFGAANTNIEQYYYDTDGNKIKADEYEYDNSQRNNGFTINKFEFIVDNYYYSSGSLKLTKLITADSPIEAIDKIYTFEITSSSGFDAKAYPVEGAQEEWTRPIDGKLTINVKGNSTVIIKNLPIGTCRVSEVRSSGEIAGYFLNVSGEGDIQIESDETIEKEIINDYSTLRLTTNFDTDDFIIKNVYSEIKTAHITLSIQKQYLEKSTSSPLNIEQDMFSFTLSPVTDSAPMPTEAVAKTGPDGKVTWQEIEYTEANEWDYTITENDPGLEDVTWDKTEHKVHVSVTTDDEGNLTAAWTWDSAPVTDTSPTVTNYHLSPVDLPLTGGSGIIAATISGSVLMAFGAVGYAVMRNRKPPKHMAHTRTRKAYRRCMRP